MIRVDDTSIYSAISWEQMTAMLPRLKMAWETLQRAPVRAGIPRLGPAAGDL